MDNFYEQLVTTYKTFQYKISNILLYITIILSAGLLLIFAFIPAIISILCAVGVYFLKRQFYVEYEYDFTNGEIDIDKILEKSKRMRNLTFNIKDVELLAPEDSIPVKDFVNKPSKILNCYPYTSTNTIYVAMITRGSERVQLRFVPDVTLLEYCFKYNPKAVRRNL